ncbi:hypothetical protein [Lacticaseibacillus sharpeae]|uniref:Uncharacterized protein n=1 Tax=Lacticaseibacillus sharpeae JCM 1186 = DSM 20505 TaxID=1291052 RepID=A0A0R1ZRM7_9LACO|nr:hypothetical protein [Lacticaseibacillus sharpeae]KRM54635.1 hypothetical protein FC18_GL002346 [Lacticaseibacillus sharpeae JCM 1186 = DSM 20505]
MNWTSWHQLLGDLTNLVKAVAPIAVAYLTYHYRKQPSAKQRKERKNKLNAK